MADKKLSENDQRTLDKIVALTGHSPEKVRALLDRLVAEPEKDRGARLRLEYFEKLVADAETTLSEHRQVLAIEREAYAKARPLTEAERNELIKHVDAGGQLCCENGLAWLSKRLPEPWARSINDWAHGALGCGFDSPEKPDRRWRDDYVLRVLGLKLDEFPRGYE